jgi:polyhydroxybutyrate depolymerase
MTAAFMRETGTTAVLPGESTLTTARYWANLAADRGEPVQDRLLDAVRDDGTTTKRWTWFNAGRPHVVLLVVEGGGHTIPHPDVAFPRVLGKDSRDFSASEAMWAFFSAHTAMH